jgi:hypothetical protein
MASWVRCKCGQLASQNLFCDAGVSLVVPEECLDIESTSVSTEKLQAEIVLKSQKLLKCKKCQRLILLSKFEENYSIQFFQPDNE